MKKEIFQLSKACECLKFFIVDDVDARKDNSSHQQDMKSCWTPKRSNSHWLQMGLKDQKRW